MSRSEDFQFLFVLCAWTVVFIPQKKRSTRVTRNNTNEAEDAR